MKPVLEHKFQIPDEKSFVNIVFRHLDEMIEVNSKFLDDLVERQEEETVVSGIADVFLKHVSFFPFKVKSPWLTMMGI